MDIKTLTSEIATIKHKNPLSDLKKNSQYMQGEKYRKVRS
jgi:hypothetical protein